MSDQKLIIGYYRLSMEDDSEGESNSIINQRKLVKDYISNIPELASMPFQEFAAVRINFACLKELRQIAGKELRQKSFSGVIIRNQGMIQRILCETDR